MLWCVLCQIVGRILLWIDTNAKSTLLVREIHIKRNKKCVFPNLQANCCFQTNGLRRLTNKTRVVSNPVNSISFEVFSEIRMKCLGWGDVHWTQTIQSGGPGQKPKSEIVHYNGEESYFKSVIVLYGKSKSKFFYRKILLCYFGIFSYPFKT